MHIPTYEGFRLKILEFRRLWLAGFRNRQLKNRDFTIISNNCWGGMVYESYELPKMSPTIGLFFMADDYITFLENLSGYLSSELVFINPKDSRWAESKEIREDPRFGSYPIARISDGTNVIEVFFLHYHSQKEAKEKWERRVGRVNWNQLLIKFNDQNGCTPDHLNRFNALSFRNKLFFTCHPWKSGSNVTVVQVRQPKAYKSITASHEPFGSTGVFDVTHYINSL